MELKLDLRNKQYDIRRRFDKENLKKAETTYKENKQNLCEVTGRHIANYSRVLYDHESAIVKILQEDNPIEYNTDLEGVHLVCEMAYYMIEAKNLWRLRDTEGSYFMRKYVEFVYLEHLSTEQLLRIILNGDIKKKWVNKFIWKPVKFIDSSWISEEIEKIENKDFGDVTDRVDPDLLEYFDLAEYDFLENVIVLLQNGEGRVLKMMMEDIRGGLTVIPTNKYDVQSRNKESLSLKIKNKK